MVESLALVAACAWVVVDLEERKKVLVHPSSVVALLAHRIVLEVVLVAGSLGVRLGSRLEVRQIDEGLRKRRVSVHCQLGPYNIKSGCSDSPP